MQSYSSYFLLRVYGDTQLILLMENVPGLNELE